MQNQLATDLHQIIEPPRIESIVESKNRSVMELQDTALLLEVANGLNADFVVSGLIMTMRESMMVLSKIIRVDNEEVLSVAQSILRKSDIQKSNLAD